jgi:hypothetical protein
MTRPIKASIFNPDRTLSIYYVKSKQMMDPNHFKLKGSNEVYQIDASKSVTTKTRKMFIPFRFTTYYYKRNDPCPLPCPEFPAWDNKGLSSRQLGTLFDSVFYQMIAKSNKNKREDLMMYLAIGNIAGVAFLIYYVMQNLPKAIAALLAATGHK